MLSEQEKQRIRAEEIYRYEVKQELKDKSKGKGNTLLRFLDTQHGLFIASMIVLPFVIWFFTFMQTKYIKYNDEQQLIKQLDNEIVYRVSNCYGRLKSGDVTGFIKDVDRNYIYPQFSGVGIQGLMLQLESLVCESDRSGIATARNALISGNKVEIESSLRIREWSK